VKAFLARYSATWTKAHSESSAQARVAKVGLNSSKTASPSPNDVTAGIIRSDSLGQDDPDDTSKQFADETPPLVVPDSAQKAAWGAFVQSLYGSAEFQFAR